MARSPRLSLICVVFRVAPRLVAFRPGTNCGMALTIGFLSQEQGSLEVRRKLSKSEVPDVSADVSIDVPDEKIGNRFSTV